MGDPNTDAWRRFFDANTWAQQFGQTDDESTFNGSTGCTHTCFQLLIKGLTGVRYSHDQLSTIASYPWPYANRAMRGLRTGGTDDESGRLINHFHLPYQIRFGLSFATIREKMKLGPVLIGVRYGYWPELKGFHYNGRVADGRPNGYAHRWGKTQLSGAESIFHAVLVAGSLGVVNGHYSMIAREPNHGSGSRPEKPDWDTVTFTQVKRAYEMYGSTGRHLMAIIPTKSWKPKGY